MIKDITGTADKIRIWIMDKGTVSLLNFIYLINMPWLQKYTLTYYCIKGQDIYNLSSNSSSQ